MVFYRRIFADVIVYIFAHQHTTYLIGAVAVYYELNAKVERAD